MSKNSASPSPDILTDPAALLAHLHLPAHDVDLTPDFRMRVPRGYVQAMRPGDAADPLLRQVLPLTAERETVAGFSDDPTADRQACKTPGLLHKYAGRALVMTTAACAIHCRYCFRRHYPYTDLPPEWRAGVLAHIREETSLSEIILSGGDPLSLSDDKLRAWCEDLAAIPHVQRLRIHTRTPVVLPARVSTDLLTVLTAGRLPVIMVIHANHERELQPAVRQALQQLAARGIWLLNQSVLLRGVNDTIDTLAALSEALYTCRVMPYYLHMLDPVQGAAHFAVPEAEARAMLTALRARLPGYLVPRLVREVPGEASKVPVGYGIRAI